MNLIDKLKGYENSVKVLYGYKNFGWTLQAVEVHFGFEFTIEQLDKTLLEYRRQNNIFEIGDLVVFKSEYSKDSVIHKIDSLRAGTKCLRHATDEEIEKGYRV